MPLQDSDNFIIGRGEDSYKITYQDLKDDLNYVPPPVGTIDQPTVLEPNDGEGSGSSTYAKSSAITNIEGGGTITCETDPINNVITSYSSQATGTFTNVANAFDGNSSTAARWGDSTKPGTFRFNPPLSGELGLSVRQSNNHTFTITHAGGTTDWNNPSYDSSTTGSRSLETVGTFTDITAITSNSLPAYNNEVDRISIDGTVLTDTAGITLEFPTNKDLHCFEVDDVVQGVDTAAVVTTNNPAGFQSGRGPENILSGDKTTRCDAASSNTGDYQYGIFVDIEALLGPNYTGELDVYTNYNTASADGDRYKYYVVYTDNTESSKVNFNTGGGWIKVNSAGSKPVKYLVATAVDGRTPGLWTAIGTNNNDASIILSNSVKITDKEPDANPPTITVNGGNWVAANQDQEWSANSSFTGSEPPADQLAPAGFNGSTSYTDGYFYAVQGGTQTVTFNLPFTKLEVWTWNHAPGNGALEINDTPISQEISDDPDAKDFFDGGFKFDATSLVTSPLTSIKAIKTATGTSGGFTAVYVDGKMLVDPSADVATKLSKTSSYDTKLTFAGSTDLADMTGSVFMSDGNPAGGPYTQTPYKLVTTDIESVDDTDPANVTLTFPGDVSTNPDLKYFKAGDVVQTQATSAVLHTTSEGDGSFADGAKFTGFEAAAIDMSSTEVQAVPNNVINPWDTYGKAYKQLVFDLLNEDGDFLFGSSSSGWATASSVDGVNWVQESTASPGVVPDQSVRALMIRQPKARYLAIGNLTHDYSWADYFSVQFNQSLVDTWTSRNFEPGGLQFEDPNVTVISTGYPDSNTMVVDGGTWDTSNQNQVWSTLWTGLGQYQVDPAIVFNGDTTVSADNRLAIDKAYEDVNPTFSFQSTAGKEVEILAAKRTNAKQATFNGVEFTVPTTTDIQGSWVTAGNTIDGTNTFAWDTDTTGGASENYDIFGFRVDGTVLVDPVGDSNVEYQTKGGQGDIIKVNTGDSTMMLENTGDRDNRWIKGFSVAGPSVIDTPLLTNDVQLRGSDFATTPPGADTLKEIIWSINGVEYSAGVTNPWSPLEKLPTNSTVTVKVKYKGNTLEDSVWSPTVTFTTGATLRSLFTRIAALEANDVTDDATDTALITLIAGLAQRIQALEESN